jgi:hypothetical protein
MSAAKREQPGTVLFGSRTPCRDLAHEIGSGVGGTRTYTGASGLDLVLQGVDVTTSADNKREREREREREKRCGRRRHGRGDRGDGEFMSRVLDGKVHDERMYVLDFLADRIGEAVRGLQLLQEVDRFSGGGGYWCVVRRCTREKRREKGSGEWLVTNTTSGTPTFSWRLCSLAFLCHRRSCASSSRPRTLRRSHH